MDSKEILEKLRVNIDNYDKRIFMLEGYCKFLESLLENANIPFLKIDTTKENNSIKIEIPKDDDNKVVGFR